VEVGFDKELAIRALQSVEDENVEAALEWLLEQPVDDAVESPVANNIGPLLEFGFSERQCRAALVEGGGNLERAESWLFKNIDKIDEAVRDVEDRGRRRS
jgi:uncharacterized UBP type Zn finger protein